MKKKKPPATTAEKPSGLHGKVLLFIAAFLLLGIGAIISYQNIPASFWKGLDISSGYIWLPDIVANYFEGKRISLHFYLSSGEVLDVCGTVIPQGKSISRFNMVAPRPSITELSWSVCDEWDYDVSMSDFNALSLATSTTPTRTFASLMDSGEIKVKPNGQDNALRFQYAYNEFRRQDGQPVPDDIRAIFEPYLPNASSDNSG